MYIYICVHVCHNCVCLQAIKHMSNNYCQIEIAVNRIVPCAAVNYRCVCVYGKSSMIYNHAEMLGKTHPY